MPCPIKRIHFGNYIFNLYEDIYEPAEDSFLFADNLDLKEGDLVLDIGTGCGLLGILTAKKAGVVIAIDLNPYAIRCARENSVLNGLCNKLGLIQANLFDALNSKATFDLILFNAPYLPSDQTEGASWIERSWAGGTDGREVVDLFISEVSLHLAPFGRVLLMQSTLTNVGKTIRKFKEYGLKAVVKAERKLPFFEKLALIEAKFSV